MRELEALAPMAYTLIAERRLRRPRGHDGGEDGSPGRDSLNGEPIAGKSSGRLAPGDRLRIETPGGGGYGPVNWLINQGRNRMGMGFSPLRNKRRSL